MNKIKILCLLLALCGMRAMAQDFSVDGINYTKIPCGEYICTSFQVTVAPGTYSGDVVIPAMVRYEGVDYEVLRIGARAFEGCTGLTSVTVQPGYLAMVVFDAFHNCTNLRKVDLPATIAMLDDNIFNGCTSLDTIYLRSTTPPEPTFNADLTFYGLNPNAVFVVPCGCLSAYGESSLFSSVTVIDDCDNTMDINNVSTTQLVKVYPNPATHQVMVNVGGEVLLFDSRGYLLRRQSTNGDQIVFDLDGLTPGIYFLRSGDSTVKLAVK